MRDLSQVDVERISKERGDIRTINQGHLSALEQDQKKPGSDFLISLAKIYETSTDYILGLIDENVITRLEEEKSTAMSSEAAEVAAIIDRMSPSQRWKIIALVKLLSDF